jgi:hypothetical protein
MGHPAIAEYKRISEMLADDVQEVIRMFRASPTECMRRTYAKTAFTFLEGDLYAFKQLILALEKILTLWIPPRGASHIVLFTEEQRAMLKEFTYEITNDGEARQTTYRARFTDSFKFVVNVLHQVMRLDSKVNYSDPGWNALINARKIRNRLTHPKSLESLAVTDNDIETIQTAVGWYEATINNMLDRLYNESFYAPRFGNDLRRKGSDDVPNT